ncbi:MAG TPA: hypothetical protein VHB54_01555 [Mucilaginibacter sp.]|nr:hypothetical protein [Mucilaginibacter sp.]
MGLHLRTGSLFILLLITAAYTRAQQFGGNPPSIKWDQINTPPAKVIFPRGLDSIAQEVANIVMQMNGVVKPTIGNKQKQISIVLQNQTIISNAYVGLAPFRSEFYLTPDPNNFELGSLPWPEQLAIHEFRHVQQYNNFNVGLSRALHILFGEGGQALGNDLAIPNWFFEGDAVFNETLVSKQGRGRLPFFLDGYRALWAADKNYSWMKLRNGSYRDYTPDWYPTGYMLVSYGRENFGNQFWRNVTHDAAAFDGIFYPLQRAVKKYSGESFTAFRDSAFNYYRKKFNSDRREGLGDNSIVRSRHFVADQEYPAYVNDTTLIYMKSTYNHLPEFVARTPRGERVISIRDISLDNYFDYHDGKIVYAAYRPDLRWTYRDYSELQLLDVATGKEKQLTFRSKYFSPAFSDDGTTIVAAQVAPTGKSELHLLSADDGKLVGVVPNPGGVFYTYPRFYGADKLISAIRTPKGEMTLGMIDIKTGKIDYLLPLSYQPIGFVTVRKDAAYFTATSGMNDRLFKLSLTDRKFFELKNYYKRGYIGNYEPAVSENKLSWVGFTAVGYQLSERKRSDLQWDKINTRLPGALPDWGIKTLNRDSAKDLLDKVELEPLAVTKYPKAYNLFNFHSIIPNINDPNYSIGIVGENVLNTFQSQLTFNYNRDEQYKELSFDAVYGALFPFLRTGIDYVIDRRSFYNGKNVYWNETNLYTGFEVPLILNRGIHITGLSFGSDIYYSRTDFQPPFRQTFHSTSYSYLNNYVSFSTHVGQAVQNIYPRWGQNLSLNYKAAITGISAQQFLASGNLFFPGLVVNHNLVVNLAYQQKGADNVIDFSNNFPFARGYFAENLHRMDKAGADYHFPIAYPDVGTANLIYVLRLRGDVFYDYTRGYDRFIDGSSYKNFRSAGAALFFDTQWFNQASVSFGIRYDYLLDPDIFGGPGRSRFEIVLPVTVF